MLALLSLVLQASTPAVVTSAAPDAVAVTVYRNPVRRAGSQIDLRWLEGRALVTETRTVDLPAGAAQIRFEGVADGIVPVSAIVTGLPGGTVEKNRDARLLSPAALVDGTLGRIVTIRRTDRRSGAVREEEARIIAGSAGGVVLQTAGGVMALGCSGLREKPLYGAVPDGLSSRPTLSVSTVSPQAGRATIRLSYLADAFDWQADYIGRLGEDGRTMELFAWLTLANANQVSFTDAETMAVAGRVEQDADAPRGDMASAVAALSLSCWPMGTTTDGLDGDLRFAVSAPPPPPPPPPPAPMMAESIVVTARRNSVPVAAMMTQQENLGDLKLYRIPERVTVAANSQKQVALLTRAGVPYATIYSLVVGPDEHEEARPADIMLRLHNREKDGLGLPLPSGRIAVTAPRGENDILIGQGEIADTAIGEDANLSIGKSPQVRGLLTETAERRWRYEISNANPFAVDVEAVLQFDPSTLSGAAKGLPTRNGLPLWKVTVPAHATRSIGFATKTEN